MEIKPMEIKPMFDNTIRMNMTNVKLAAPKIQKKAKYQIIPNGIYKVIRGEKIRQFFTIIITSLLLLAGLIMIAAYQLVMDVSGVAYLIPGILMLLSFGKLFVTVLEVKGLSKALDRYKDDLKIGINNTPPFISNLYMTINQKQVSHNGFTIAVLFYGGIATLLLGGLKDFSGGLLDFKTGVADLFSNPTTMAGLFTALLISVSVIHVVFAIQRQKRIQDIRSFFGGEISSAADIETMKQAKSKMYRRLFILSIMILVLIPIVVRFILKIISGKK